MTDNWLPFGWDETRRDEYEVLLDGVPHLLREPLSLWIGARLAASVYRKVVMEDVYRLQSKIKAEIGVNGQWSAYDVAGMFEQSNDDLFTLQVVDGILALQIDLNGDSYRELVELLDRNNSKWQVGERRGHLALVARVAEGVQDFSQDVQTESGTAGELLARAWANVHGLQANATSAYADAVRAAEVAAIAVVQPKHANATLGTVLGQMKADGDWSLPLQKGPADLASSELLRGIMRTLWEGHRDRHGNVTYSDVTLEEARVAVGLATTIVDWFHAGLVSR